jgi:hypothetical protein
VSYTFTGRELLWIAPVTARSGRAIVYIDGRRTATVNLHSSATRHGRVVYRKAFATAGKHTIRIVVATTGKRVSVDAFIVLK